MSLCVVSAVHYRDKLLWKACLTHLRWRILPREAELCNTTHTEARPAHATLSTTQVPSSSPSVMQRTGLLFAWDSRWKSKGARGPRCHRMTFIAFIAFELLAMFEPSHTVWRHWVRAAGDGRTPKPAEGSGGDRSGGSGGGGEGIGGFQAVVGRPCTSLAPSIQQQDPEASPEQ